MKTSSHIKSGTEYHVVTSYDRFQMSPHAMDWQHTPNQYKSYPPLPTIHLKVDDEIEASSFWDLIAPAEDKPGKEMHPDINTLAHVLALAYGFTAKQRMGSKTYFYRSAPSAGALYPGFYLLSTNTREYGLVMTGDFRQGMAQVCLDQMWLEKAAAHFLFLADLGEIDRKLGARGYRYAMMNAGRLGHRLYLGASAMGMGCCGIGALYDGEAKTLLQLNENSYLLYLVVVGVVSSNISSI